MSTNKKPATHRFQPLPTGKKVFDVVRPGKTPALPNSRAVLMQNSPEATDGQFVVPVGTPTLPGAVSREVKHPLTVSKEHEATAPTALEQEQLPLAPSEAPTKEETQPERPAEQPEAQENRPAKTPSVVMLSEIDALLENEPAEEAERPAEQAKAEEEAQEPEEGETMPQPDQEPAKGRRLSIRVHQDVEVVPEEAVESGGAEPIVQADVTQALVKPLTEEEIAAHLSHDDLLANTHFDHENMVVSDHRHRMRVWQFILIFLIIVGLALVALNFLLDAEIIKTELDIPHTNLIAN